MVTRSKGKEPEARPWVPSFDEDAVTKQLSSADVEQAILRAHLWVEYFVVQLLSGALPNPDALRIDRLTFVLKIELCLSLGVMPSDLAPALLCLNGLRNKAVHKLDYKFQKADKRALLDSFSTDVRDELLREHSFETLDFSVLLKCLVFLLDSLRHFHEERRRLKQERWNQFVRDHGKTVERAFASVGEKPPDWVYSK